MTSDLVAVDFKAEHLQLLDVSRPEMFALMHMGDLVEYGKTIEATGAAWSVFTKDGRLVWCGGIAPMWHGVGSGWMILSNVADDFPFALHRVCKTMLREAISNGYHRIQADIPCSSERARRWILRLGFESEGIMRAYGPDGTDSERFAMVKK
jgi:RimJ/RimL family protein N-acetyltransferase